jgi:uncharacterized membrane protein YgaE (UPF0421/DUF939 family)
MKLVARLSQLVVSKDNPSTFQTATRTAVAAIASYLVAWVFHLPQPYWAPISSMVVVQPSMGASLPLSVQRLTGTALGAAAGAVAATYFPNSLWAFGIAVLSIGSLCAILRTERSAFRIAGITLVIVMLIPQSAPVWVVAVHRSCEVSLGIAVGLLVSAVWPERPPKSR